MNNFTERLEEFEYEAVARLEIDMRPVLPYLNATLTHASDFINNSGSMWVATAAGLGEAGTSRPLVFGAAAKMRRVRSQSA